MKAKTLSKIVSGMLCFSCIRAW